MQYVVTAVPLLVLAIIVALVLASALRRRGVTWTMPVRTPRPKKAALRMVSRDQMDEDLKDLIRRR
jgi:hypothetical protein